MDEFNLSPLLGEVNKYTGSGDSVAVGRLGVMTPPEVTHVAVERFQGQLLYIPWKIRELECLACRQTPSVTWSLSTVSKEETQPASLELTISEETRINLGVIISYRNECFPEKNHRFT